MRGPVAFWTLLLGGIASLIVGVSLIGTPPEVLDSAASEVEPAMDRSAPASSSRDVQSAPRIEVDEQGDADWFAEEPAFVEEPFEPEWDESPRAETIRPGAVSVHQAADRLEESGPALVIFFSTTCSRSRVAFPQLVRIADGLQEELAVLAFATDSDPRAIDGFVARSGASFPVDRLEPWQSGEMGFAMGRVGIEIGQTWTMPLIAVFERDGRVLGQWQGLTDLRPVESVVRRAGFLTRR